jgi:NTE family protein
VLWRPVDRQGSRRRELVPHFAPDRRDARMMLELGALPYGLEIGMGKITLVLGGGAPNLTLMSGALAALHDQGCCFDVVSMAGGGAVVGLCYLAPKNMTPAEALRNTVNFGVSDAIYSLFPINYKIFNKGGPVAAQFRHIWERFPPVWRAEHQYGMDPLEKLQSDMLLFAGAMTTPTDVNYFSEAICAHFPFIEQLVDFDKLRRSPGPRLLMNAYCMDTKRIVEFERPCLDVHHFRAALSFPFLYAPYEINGQLYLEGAAFSCLNLINLANNYVKVKAVARSDRDANKTDPDKFILFDVLTRDLIHPPRNLWDAYTQSMILPLVADASKEQLIFQIWLETGVIHPVDPGDAMLAREINNKYISKNESELKAVQANRKASLQNVLTKFRFRSENSERLLSKAQVDELQGEIFGDLFGQDTKDRSLPLGYTKVPNAKSYHITFDVPADQQPYMLDWSRSNLELLFNAGYEAGLNFLELCGGAIWG